MGAIARWLDRFCYKHPRIGIPGLMKYIAIGTAVVYLIDMVSNGTFSALLAFMPGLILQGQIWRLVTFIIVPTGGGILFLLTVFFYYWIGSALEQQWGTTRFTVFYGLGVLLNVLLGFVLYFFMGANPYLVSATMYYVNMSMFFSFATLYPDMQVLFMGIIPLKVKWLAWVDAAFFAFDIGSYLFSGAFLFALMPVIAILNYLIFFWDDLMRILGRGKSRVAHRMNPQTVNFKKAQKEVQSRKGYLHKCAVCGVTDADSPNTEFRYCSKCNGYYCYCMEHINNHVHIQ